MANVFNLHKMFEDLFPMIINSCIVEYLESRELFSLKINSFVTESNWKRRVMYEFEYAIYGINNINDSKKYFKLWKDYYFYLYKKRMKNEEEDNYYRATFNILKSYNKNISKYSELRMLIDIFNETIFYK